MSTKKIDILNIVLILVSLFLAFKLPFELFLFSYAVLGPLHYMTEINWLKERNYFMQGNNRGWIFISLAIILSIPVILNLPVFATASKTGSIAGMVRSSNAAFYKIILASLLFTAGLVFFNKKKQRLIFFMAGCLLGIFLIKYASFSIILAGLFLPTMIHVYVFTLLFMISGTLRTKNKEGIVAICLLLICPIVIFASNINTADYNFSDFTKTTFMSSGFQRVSTYLAGAYGSLKNTDFIFSSKTGIKVQILIAFCYTYHYLNWFSKTSLIGWSKNISVAKFIVIFAVWVLAVGLYWYDYKVGLAALFFLSTLHVLLEFPLNMISVKEIYSKLKANQ